MRELPVADRLKSTSTALELMSEVPGLFFGVTDLPNRREASLPPLAEILDLSSSLQRNHPQAAKSIGLMGALRNLREASADGSSDCMVTTWTICSIPDADRAVREIHRVMKSGGRFAFLARGLS
jgi:hypothetical protein